MNRKLALYLTLIFTSLLLQAAGEPMSFQNKKVSLFKKSELVPYDFNYHRNGTLWMRVTNFSMIGDDSYRERTPSADWPGGSGNSYLYRGSLWLTGTRNGARGTSTTEDKEYTPLALVQMETLQNGLVEHSWTKFTDAIKVNDTHIPLGLEITQHAYSYGLNFADDFIIFRYFFKNVGVDTTGDGFADDLSTLQNVHFTFRMDGDVSKLTTWDAEADFVNRDDLALCLTTSWDELKLFPYMEYQMDQDTAAWPYISQFVGDSTLTIMFDGDNRGYVSEVDTSLLDLSTVSGSYLHDNANDDFANPNPVGVYQTPGVLAMQMIHSSPYMKPKSYTTSFIGQDFSGDAAMWTNAIGKTTFDKLFKLPPFLGGGVNEGDYRAITTFGPVDSLAYGDSIEVVFAIGVGADADRAGIYSFIRLVEDMEVAKTLVAENFQVDQTEIPPLAQLNIGAVLDADNVFQGVDVTWDPSASMAHPNFTGYILAKFKERTVAGLPIYDTLRVLSKAEVEAELTSTGDSYVSVFDSDVLFGYDYTYSLIVTGYSDKYFNMELATSDFITATGKSLVNTLDDILVVPNPYRASAPWNNATPSSSSQWKDRLFFINLPEDAVVRIFTLDGDFVKMIQPTDSRGIENAPETNTATAEWDLVSRSNREVAPGVYLYHVSSSLGDKTGKFIILK
ncbi:MAG: hypothetical protein HQ507_07445 [Candidatus Marinimicrobia bacterium]|nr:hypothetical protein [Candidatus Neomarinimicrobiota bacterium]